MQSCRVESKSLGFGSLPKRVTILIAMSERTNENPCYAAAPRRIATIGVRL
jgi:hypothetical protein